MTESVAAPISKYWNAEKNKFTITTQFKDPETGSPIGPVQYFEADTLEGLLEKKDAAHENAAVKLYETRKAVKLGALIEPDKDEPIQTYEERSLTADERVRVTKALNDPATAPEAVRTLLEAQFGAPVEAVREALREAEINKRVKRVREEVDLFKAGHPEYIESVENKNNLLKYLEKRGLPITKKNLEIAFNDLREDNLILVRASKAADNTSVAAPAAAAAPPPVPAITAQATATPAIPAESAEVRARQSSSGLGRDNATTSTVVGGASKTPGITIRDINRMSAKEYQDKLVSDPEFRKQVDALYAKK